MEESECMSDPYELLKKVIASDLIDIPDAPIMKLTVGKHNLIRVK